MPTPPPAEDSGWAPPGANPPGPPAPPAQAHAGTAAHRDGTRPITDLDDGDCSGGFRREGANGYNARKLPCTEPHEGEVIARSAPPVSACVDDWDEDDPATPTDSCRKPHRFQVYATLVAAGAGIAVLAGGSSSPSLKRDASGNIVRGGKARASALRAGDCFTGAAVEPTSVVTATRTSTPFSSARISGPGRRVITR
ncbi:hypothetical protein E1293_16755 [Actinomadura darangshiensis]|uniref:Uncharacterized protein n=1 Tax=Actinomadura darangshiensis TaxID=705336 RepID=A0A4V2YVP8_9ACTN|nr:hypothetical protein [Actinomadura darangshiensis]TDD82437.1 hypothetical protein E1293_16755 [Actinomadura darangshiensis]